MAKKMSAMLISLFTMYKLNQGYMVKPSGGWHLSNPTKILREYTVSVPIIPDIDQGGQFNFIEISNDLYDLGDTKIYTIDWLCFYFSFPRCGKSYKLKL